MIKSVFGIGRDKEDPRKCVLEAVKDFVSPKLIMFFSEAEHFEEYAAVIHELFPNAVSMGCTAYRTWGPSGVKKDVLQVMAVEEGIVCFGGVIEKADNFALNYADNVRRCVEEVGETDNTICVEFTVPLKSAEEYALMALNSVLLRKGIEIVGGSAGNKLDEDSLYSSLCLVALNGVVYPDGCVFVLIHSLSGKIYLLRENLYEPLTGKELLVTKANSETRTIMTCDDRVAAEVYASELNVPREEIKKYYFHFPMGRRIGDEIFMAAIGDDDVNGNMKYLARVHEGTSMMVMKEGDYKSITADTIKTVRERTGTPPLVIVFQCTARTILFEEKGYVEEYSKMLSDAFPNYIGFSCNGEQHNTKHFNHTLMLAVFE